MLYHWTNSEKEDNKTLESDLVLSDEYEHYVENKIENIVNSINGISEAKAFVYTKGSIEIIYAEDKEIKTSGGDNRSLTELQSIVFTKDGTKTSAVVIKKNYQFIFITQKSKKCINNTMTNLKYCCKFNIMSESFLYK